MKKWRKLTVVFLVATMIFSSIALSGCGKKKKQGETISEDTPWYTIEKIDLSASYYDEYTDLDYIYFSYCGTVDGNYLLSVNGSRKTPDDFDWENGDWSEFNIYDLVTFDSEGNKLNTIDLQDVTSGDYEYIEHFEVVNDEVEVTIVVYDSRTWDETRIKMTLNPVTGEMGERVEVSVSDEIYSNENESSEGTVNVGDYVITKLWKYGNDINTYRLVVTDSEGNSTSLDMETLFPGVTVYNIDSIVDCGDNTGLILASGQGTENMVFEIDLNSMTLTQQSDEDAEWLKDVNAYNIVNCNDAAYTVDNDGVRILDFDNHSAEEVFSFNYCNVSRYDVPNYTLLEISDDELVFMANEYHYYNYLENSDTYSIVRLTRAETNPNVGKTIISLGCLNGISESIASAVCDYNDTNEEYFITYVNDYGDYEIDWQDDWSDEDRNNALMNAQADMSNQLAMDLMNGDGPDIIIGGFMYGQLNNENYLLDISDYVNDFGVSGYFSNVFDGAKTGDKLFQLPLGFYLSGIVTDRSNVNDGQTGFTFEEYLQFVDEVCNGKDPITMGRISYFAECVNAMNDLFIDGNSVDYNNEAFTTLAQYCKDNVNEEYDFGDEDDGMIWSDSWTPDPANYSSFSGFSDYLNSYNSTNGPESQIILGLPSYDGRGPAIQVADSAAISVTASDPDACWGFIEVLLGSKTQEMIAKGWYFPVSVDAFETVAQLQVNGYNEVVRNQGNYFYPGFESIRAEIDSSIIDDFETEIIASAHLVSNDPSITVIISEEIPAYFSGQKDIDQVVDILENRVNTVLSERG